MVDLINHYLSVYGLIVIFILMLTNGLISAPPSEVTLVLAGLWASSGQSTLTSVVVCAVLGNISGAYILYYIGRTYGAGWIVNLKKKNSRWAVIRLVVHRLPDQEKIQILSILFRQRSLLLIGVFRCFPVVRSIVSLPAGMVKVHLGKFTFMSLAGMSLWAVFWGGIGMFSFKIYTNYSAHITLALFAGMLLCLVSIYSYLKKLSVQILGSKHNKAKH